jgi:hypothetical protein
MGWQPGRGEPEEGFRENAKKDRRSFNLRLSVLFGILSVFVLLLIWVNECGVGK